MPSRSQALTLLRTYTSDAGLCPARITAKPGRWPASVRARTCPASSEIICAAILVPSRTVAALRTYLKLTGGSFGNAKAVAFQLPGWRKLGGAIVGPATDM